MLLEQAVDLGDLDARARRDAALARGLQDVRLLALLARHRADDRALAADHAVRDTGLRDLFLHLLDAGQHAHQAFHAAELLHLGELAVHVLEVELTLGQLLGHGHRLGLVEIGGGLFDQGHHIALAQDAAGDTAGVEHVERVDALASPEELDRQAGDGPHRQRRAAARVAVGAGQERGRSAAVVRERPWRCAPRPGR